MSPQEPKQNIYSRVVIKAGTTLLTHSTDRLNLQVMATLVEQLAMLHAQSVEIVLVSSGAIAAGRHALGVPKASREVRFRQVLAAAGQSKLMHSYEQLFDWHEIPVAQALLSRKDLSDRIGYLNVRNTLMELLRLNVVPIINENDVVAVEELEGEIFGDNDNLSSMVANIIDADLLILLGEVDGLFTADPNIEPTAKLIPIVEKVTEDMESLAGKSWNDRGRGGMTTKLQAARAAASTGVHVVIANGHEPNVLTRLCKGENIGTMFPTTNTKRESRERWMLSGASTRGEIIIDDGAREALVSNNKSLLPAGISSVKGSFDRGDIVSILDSSHTKIAVGIVNYSSKEVVSIEGSHSNQIGDILGHHYGDEVVHRNNMVVL